MTRKHFAAVAADIKENVEAADGNTDAIRTLRQLAGDLARTFKLFNPNFDRVRFLTACGF